MKAPMGLASDEDVSLYFQDSHGYVLIQSKRERQAGRITSTKHML